MKSKPKSHARASHTQDSASKGLQGSFQRPIKITMLGAGSGFTPRLVNDVLRIPGEQGGTIALVDIDRGRLATMHRLIEKFIASLGKTNWKVESSAERRDVLRGSDYIINCIEVSGIDCVRFDNDIPLKYGVDQCIGDTIGPGGLFKALRTIPVWLAALRDCEKLCPKALVLNYTNPMAMMCLAAGRTTDTPVVGLCHSVQGTSQLLAGYAGVPYGEMAWECAGINHLSWFTKLEHRGADLYPRLKRKFAREIAGALAQYPQGRGRASHRRVWNDFAKGPEDLVRKDMCLHFGAFITESSGHLSEYLPYYRKSAAGRSLLAPTYDGESRFYASYWPRWRKAADADRLAMLQGKKDMVWERSWEYASWIIEAREKDTPFRIHGNFMNRDAGGHGLLVTNLPSDGCVEVACMIDRNGFNPTRYGALPAQMAAICQSNMSFFDLGAQAAIDHSIEAAVHALLLDPLTAAVCTPAQIKAMALEMFRAEKAFLPGYR